MSPKEAKPGVYGTLVEYAMGLWDDVKDKFVHPPVSSKDEIESFNVQSSCFNHSAPPKRLDMAVHAAESALAFQCSYSLPGDWGTLAHIVRECERVSKEGSDKSPGAIFQRQGFSTNKQVFEHYGVEGIAAQVQDRIEKLLKATPEEARQLSDPVKLFIKRQAHKMSKARVKRWRLIWGVSLIDQLVDRVLYTEMLDTAKANSAEIPLKPGYSFKNGGVSRMVRRYGLDRRSDWASFDAKSYDFTVAGWMLDAIRDLNIRLCRNRSQFPDWERLVLAREEASGYGSFVFSNGTVCLKTAKGLQHSGRFTTIDHNCKGMLLLRFAYDLERDVAPSAESLILMGDDSVQRGIDPVAYIQWAEQYGVTLTYEGKTDQDGKPVLGRFDEQNFCSMDFKEFTPGTWVGVPRNLELSLYELVRPEVRQVDTQGESLLNLCVEYAFHPMGEKMLATLGELHPKNWHSREWCQRIWTGWEAA